MLDERNSCPGVHRQDDCVGRDKFSTARVCLQNELGCVCLNKRIKAISNSYGQLRIDDNDKKLRKTQI